MLKDVYAILKPLGLCATFGSMSILVGVLLLPGINYGDLKTFTSTAVVYSKSIVFFIFGTGLFLYNVWTATEKARNIDDAKKEIEKLKADAKYKELQYEEIRTEVARKQEDKKLRTHHAREHLRLFQDYLSVLARVRSKAKVESFDVEAATEVCERVAHHWDEADKSGIFYNFYELSHKMYHIRMELEGGLKRLIGKNADNVEEICDYLYKRIQSLQKEMKTELKSIEDRLFSCDYLSPTSSGQSPH
jgi:hypothetical protein